jgi:ATP-dependent helicase/nuclease subunit B
MPSVNIKNETTRKSSIINEIENTLDIKMVGEVTNTKDLDIKFDDIYSKEKCFEYMVKKMKSLNESILDLENIEDTRKITSQINEIIGIYEYFNSNEKYHEIINYLKCTDNLSKESINNIYKEEFKSSVYKLEQFKKCPFAYYMRYILNIQKRKVYEITSMDTGNIMHNILDIFSKYLIQNQINWSKIIDENNILIDMYKEKLNTIIEDLLKNEFKKQKESVKYGIYKRKLENTMAKVIAIVARSFKQSDFEVLGNEIEFNDNCMYLPINLKLDNDINMKIIGKIDRVDTYTDEDKTYIRVVDYKSSKKNLTVDDIKEGVSLQLITYISAILQNYDKNKTAIPAACLYFNLSDKLIKLKDYTTDSNIIKNEIIKNLRMNGLFLKDIKILENMDKYVKDSSNKLIDITPNRIDSSKKALEEKEFLNLCKEAKSILQSIGNEMIKGVVQINPNKNKEACKFCDFSSVCRKDSCI